MNNSHSTLRDFRSETDIRPYVSLSWASSGIRYFVTKFKSFGIKLNMIYLETMPSKTRFFVCNTSIWDFRECMITRTEGWRSWYGYWNSEVLDRIATRSSSQLWIICKTGQSEINHRAFFGDAIQLFTDQIQIESPHWTFPYPFLVGQSEIRGPTSHWTWYLWSVVKLKVITDNDKSSRLV